jgi:methionyl-tRNA formyltransferase
MNIVFMGTSEFAVPSLEILNDHFTVSAVITQPDRPKGRGHRLEPTPVKQAAQLLNLPVYQFASIKDASAVETISALGPDLIVVVSYGQLIPAKVLAIPLRGCINVHASLLPRYRGAAPIQRAIMAGEKTTGVTTMFMDEGLDTGDIILQTVVDIPADMNHGTLEQILAKTGAQLLLQTIEELQAGTAQPCAQDDSQATYAAMIHAQDEIIDWNDAAGKIHNQIRALNPKPGSHTTFGGIKLKIFASRVHEQEASQAAGTFLRATQEGFLVQTGQGCLEVLEVQREGRKRMPAKDFVKGVRLNPGDQLGS